MQFFHPPHPRPPHPRPPHPPRSEQGYLLQKIIACEKRSVPCLQTEWRFDCCDANTIQSVTACGTPAWTLENGCTLRVSLPVSVRACDACGRCCARPAAVDVETDLPDHLLCGMNDPRNTLFILPCIRLIRADCACGGCFRVQMHISLEICLLRYEICRCGTSKPECPQLPLYPPPMC